MKKKQMITPWFTAIALLFGAVTSSAGPVEWKAQSLFAPEDASTSVQAKMVVEATNKALSGQLSTTLYQSGQLIPVEEMTAGLSRGVFDAAITVPMMVEPSAIVTFGLPYGLGDYDKLMEFWYGQGYVEDVRKLYKKKKIHFVGPLPFGPVGLFSKFPVQRLEDIKGKKIWTEGPLADLVKALGGQPVWFDPAEIYMGLKLGTIDGIFMGWAELESIKLKEVVDYILMPSVMPIVSFDWVVSERSWDKLSAEEQATYEKAFRDTMKAQYEESMKVCKHGLEKAKEYGVEINTLSKEEEARFVKAAMKVWDDLGKDDPFVAASVEKMKKLMN